MEAKHYDPRFVRALFDEMAQTYGLVNLISSFGFAASWRRKCVREVQIQRGHTVVDLMTGMGELCVDLSKMVGATGRIIALDISPVMCARARRTVQNLNCQAEVIEADVLASTLETGRADIVVSSFGLKTFSEAQLTDLAQELARLLKPGGRFSLLEISVPQNGMLRWPYMRYVKTVIPIIGRILLGNPENYRMLGRYTEAFVDCGRMVKACARVGLNARQVSYFGGCATCVVGEKV